MLWGEGKGSPEGTCHPIHHGWAFVFCPKSAPDALGQVSEVPGRGGKNDPQIHRVIDATGKPGSQQGEKPPELVAGGEGHLLERL